MEANKICIFIKLHVLVAYLRRERDKIAVWKIACPGERLSEKSLDQSDEIYRGVES